MVFFPASFFLPAAERGQIHPVLRIWRRSRKKGAGVGCPDGEGGERGTGAVIRLLRVLRRKPDRRRGQTSTPLPFRAFGSFRDGRHGAFLDEPGKNEILAAGKMMKKTGYAEREESAEKEQFAGEETARWGGNVCWKKYMEKEK